MRLAGLPSNASKPIRCDLIGSDVCPTPSVELLENVTAPVGYGVASIWGGHRNRGPQCELSGKLTGFAGLQQYMTSLYQVLETEQGIQLAVNGFLNQTVPRDALPILKDILEAITDPIASNLSTLITPQTPRIIGQKSWDIPVTGQVTSIVGQTIGYLLQWMMTDWTAGGFTTLTTGGNLIDLLVDDGW